VAIRRRTIGIGVGVAVGVLLLCGGPIAFLRFAGPLDRVPSEDEMPRASEVPVPSELELVDGHCSGGNAGCYKGIQVFDLRAVGATERKALHCDEFERNLEGSGWTLDAIVDLGSERGYLNPDRTVAAKCEDNVVRDERSSTVTVLWPGRLEFLPYKP
jgi:hypothetical protein